MNVPDLSPPTLSDIPEEVRDEIDNKIRSIEHAESVRMLFAIESGSRAWGLPSPDSDFDVRFVYAHKVDWYLALDLRRDVIELPIVDELDISGWDLRKALRLLLKANPVLSEWLQSPIRYRWSEDANRLCELADKITFANAGVHHYRSLAESQYRRFIDGHMQIPAKKYFYVLRPTLALMWLRCNPGTRPPMSLQQLAAGVPLDDTLRARNGDLVRAKSATRELGQMERSPIIDRFIEEELSAAPAQPDADNEEHLRAANTLFCQMIGGGISSAP